MPAKKQKTEPAPATRTASTQPARIFDVAKPGALAPEGASARPVIVTNRAIVQDPMMTPKTTGDALVDTNDNESMLQSAQKIVIQPLSEQSGAAKTKPGSQSITIRHDADADGVVEPSETKQLKPTDSMLADTATGEKSAIKQQTTTAEPEPAKPTVAETPPEEKPTPADPAANLDALDADKDAAKMEAEAKAQDEIDTLVAEKTYFLPINSVVQRRSRTVFELGSILITILLVLWLDIAMDAGFVKIPGLHAITHIFHN